MFIIFILSIIPAVIWTFIAPISSRFADLSSITTSIGQLLGLTGMALFSINLILAGRYEFLDKFFHGLDKVYAHHSRIGALAFSMLLFHPLLLVVKYIAISTQQAALFLLSFNNIPNTWGSIGLAIMIILIGFTFYIKLKYHIWKISHKFMVLAFVFAILHTLVITSDISRNALLRYYILILAFTGLIISVRKAFLDEYLVKKINYKIFRVNQLNKDIVEVEMKPEDKLMDFNPGQFAFFNFLSEGVSSESHPFSISSDEKDRNLKITVKDFGDFTHDLKKVKVGDTVLIDGPYGNFNYREAKNKNQIWIAGGIGVTPFLSMMKSLDSTYNVEMYYAVRENMEAVHIKDFVETAEKYQNFKYSLWISKDSGYLTCKTILNLSKGLDSKDIFLCGPPVFMESLKNQFIRLGVDAKRIHYENFNFFN